MSLYPAVSMHPLLVCLFIAIIAGIVHHLCSRSQRHIPAAELSGMGIGVVLVAPVQAAVEPRIVALAQAAARPAALRFYVAKMCAVDEAPPELQSLQVRVSTRMHLVRARRNTAAALRAHLVREVIDPYTLVLTWDHEVDMGWDDTLLDALRMCPGPRAALVSTRPPLRGQDGGFLALEDFRDNRVRISRKAFAVPPNLPLPSIAMSAQLAFGESAALRDHWPTRELLQGGNEDATATATLWMGGIDFYTPVDAGFFVSQSIVDDGGEMHTPQRGQRTRAELLTALGVRKGGTTSRARAGLSPAANANERYAKLGQTMTLRRHL